LGTGKFYLTHFAVIRKDRLSTKVRPVFNGALKFGGKSLNDAVLAGPKMINDIVDVLQFFRREKVALSCDIKEMFLQVSMTPEDQAYHHFLWSKSGKIEEAEEYRWRKHIFGNAGSPCVAIYSIKEWARRRADIYPLAAFVVENATIVDDNLISVETVAEAKETIQQLKKLYAEIGMDIAKFMSSHPDVLSELPEDERAPTMDLADLQEATMTAPAVKALGIYYSAADDAFSFRKDLPEKMTVWTMRKLLSFYATLFDPLGFISPVVIQARIHFQKLWPRGYGWDEEIPAKEVEDWMKWLESLPALSQLSIPR
ncbi:MAG: hypothetical protein AAFY57_20675, partial [Cyanobacteria bacterium J06642_2]